MILNPEGVKKLKDILMSVFNEGYQRGLPSKPGTIFEAVDFDYYAQAICSLANKPVSLPLLTDDDYDHPKYPNQSLLKIVPEWDSLASYQKNQLRLLCEAQRDADLQALNSQNSWQEKPDKVGWWVRWEFYDQIEGHEVRVQYLDNDGIKNIVGRHINAQWQFIPEPPLPQEEG